MMPMAAGAQVYIHDLDWSGVREQIGLGQLRADACGYLERVLTGETIEVVRRGRLVARIVSANDERPVPTALPDLVAVNGAGGRIGVGALRTRAGRYFDRVEAGETIWIVWHDKLVARIVSAAKDIAPAGTSTQTASGAAREEDTQIGLDDLRMRAGRYIGRVAEGETIEVIRGGRVVAWIVPPAAVQHRTA